jgi:hypothetical protein
MTAPARALPRHHATKAGGAHPVYVCAECLTDWPCPRALARCKVCGELWSEHTDAEYQLGCRRPRR